MSELPEWAACLVFLVVVLFFAIVVASEGEEGKRGRYQRRKGRRKEGEKEGSVGLKASKRGSRQVDSRGVAGMCLLLLSSVGE